MTADALFRLCNSLALAGWLLLVVTGWSPRASRVIASLITGLLVPALLCGLYLVLITGVATEVDLVLSVASCCSSPIAGSCLPDGSTIWPSTSSSEAGRYGTQGATVCRSWRYSRAWS
jgi:hypothetical protein